MKQTESTILKAVRDFLNRNGFYVVRIHQGLGSHKGISDLVALKDGKSLWLEVKTEKGKLSRYQEEFARKVKATGNIYAVVRSVENVEAVLEGCGLLSCRRLHEV